MNKLWMKLVVAAVFEVLWVIGLAHAYSFWTWLGTISAILLCNYFLITAIKGLPAATAYTVFVGLGTVGTILSEILLFGEPANLLKILLILLLLIGVIGLKLVTDQEQQKEEDE